MMGTYNPLQVFNYQGGRIFPNTFIGGVGATINTKELLAAKFLNMDGSAFDVANIRGFKVDGNDIECYIKTPYKFINVAFKSNLDITHYKDISGLVTSLYTQEFRYASNLTEIIFNGVISIAGYTFESCNLTGNLSLPVCTTIGAYAFKSNGLLTSVNMPLLTSLPTGCFKATGLLSISVNDLPSVTSTGNFPFNSTPLVSVNMPNLETVGKELCKSVSTLTTFVAPKIKTLTSGEFWGTAVAVFDFPLLHTLTSGVNSFYNTPTTLINIPKCTVIGATVDTNNWVFNGIGVGCVINVDASLETINAGNPEADLDYAITTRLATVNYITN